MYIKNKWLLLMGIILLIILLCFFNSSESTIKLIGFILVGFLIGNSLDTKNEANF